MHRKRKIKWMSSTEVGFPACSCISSFPWPPVGTSPVLQMNMGHGTQVNRVNQLPKGGHSQIWTQSVDGQRFMNDVPVQLSYTRLLHHVFDCKILGKEMVTQSAQNNWWCHLLRVKSFAELKGQTCVHKVVCICHNIFLN